MATLTASAITPAVASFLATKPSVTAIQTMLGTTSLTQMDRVRLQRALRETAQAEADALLHDAAHKERIQQAAPAINGDGIDAEPDRMEHAPHGVYTGDDFTDREGYETQTFSTEEVDAEIRDQLDRMTRAVGNAMLAIDAGLPRDIATRYVDDRPAYLPWERMRMSLAMGMCDLIARQLERTYTGRNGQPQAAGLLPHRQRRLDDLLAGIRSRRFSDQQIAEREEELKALDEQISVLTDMLDYAAKCYDSIADRSELIRQGDAYFPPAYTRPDQRRTLAASADLAPMSGAEYETMVKFAGKDAADAEWTRRNAPPAGPGNARVTSFATPGAPPAAPDIAAALVQLLAQAAQPRR